MPHNRLIVAIDGSQIRAAAFAEILESFVRKIVEPPFASILLELPIPRLGVEPIEPFAKRRQLGS
jgi:large-conductance mechanosensitive channel